MRPRILSLLLLAALMLPLAPLSSASLTPLPPGIEGEAFVPGPMRVAGDLDGDGGGDFVLTTNLAGVGARVEALRGRDGALLWNVTLLGSGAGAIHAGRDFDGDGTPDVLVQGAWHASARCVPGCPVAFDSSAMTMLRGRDGATLWMHAADAAVAPTDDFDGDGGDDLLLTRSACAAPPACAERTRLELVRGATGATLHMRETPPGMRNGTFLTPGHTVGGPGPDLLWRVEAPCGAGFCHLFEMVDGATFATASIPPLPANTHVPRADFDGDGANDLYAYAGGALIAIRGATGATLWSVPAAWLMVIGPFGGGPGDDLLAVRRSSGVQTLERIDGATGATLLTTSTPSVDFIFLMGDHDGDGARDVALVRWTGVGVAPTPLDVPPFHRRVDIETAAGVRTHLADGAGFLDLFAGPLDGDGRDDIIVVETKSYVQSAVARTRAFAGPALAPTWSATHANVGLVPIPFHVPAAHVAAVPDVTLDGRMDVLVHAEGGRGVPTTYELRDGVTGATVWSHVTG